MSYWSTQLILLFSAERALVRDVRNAFARLSFSGPMSKIQLFKVLADRSTSFKDEILDP